MKLRLTLILFCLLCVGLFTRSQDKKKAPVKPSVETGPDAIPVTVKSNKKTHWKPPPPPPMLAKDGKPLPPPKPWAVKFSAPKIRKDGEKPPPPPAKPTKTASSQPIPPDAPPPPERTDLS